MALPESLVVRALQRGDQDVVSHFAALASRSSAPRYFTGWGRQGDAGVAAVAAGRTIGAAWRRLFPESIDGFISPSPDIPELAVAVSADFRGRGVGRFLLLELVGQAATDGCNAIDLTVSFENPAALRLYDELGFVELERDESGRRWMRRLLT
jgi:GNAT superfamily N-acetyltransferase